MHLCDNILYKVTLKQKKLDLTQIISLQIKIQMNVDYSNLFRIQLDMDLHCVSFL